MEDEIILKIKEHIVNINKLTFHDRHFEIDVIVKNILEYLLELINITKHEVKRQNYSDIYNNLFYTNNKDIKFAKSSYKKAREKNATQICERKFRLEFDKVKNQVELDLYYFTN